MPRRPGAAAAAAARMRGKPPTGEARFMPVTVPGGVGDKRAAIEIAKTRPWWPCCVLPISPFLNKGRWWFELNGQPWPT